MNPTCAYRIINSHSTQTGLNDFAAKGKFNESRYFSCRHTDILATWLESDDNGNEDDDSKNRRQRIYFDNQRSHFYINNFVNPSHGWNVNTEANKTESEFEMDRSLQLSIKFNNSSSKKREFSIMILLDTVQCPLWGKMHCLMKKINTPRTTPIDNNFVLGDQFLLLQPSEDEETCD